MEAPDRKVDVAADDRATALSAQLVLTHQSLRDRLHAVREQLLSGGPPDAPAGADLLVHCALFCAALDTHHTGEDEELLPALRREFPELASTIDKLAEDHWLVAGILRRIRDLIARAAAEDRGALVGELDGLAAIMDSHFAFEERRIRVAVDALRASPGTRWATG
jgi:hypothetical protein